MDFITRLFVKARESQRGQTMTEYALIIAAIAVAGYTAYTSLEGGINTLITNVKNTLTGAWFRVNAVKIGTPLKSDRTLRPTASSDIALALAITDRERCRRKVVDAETQARRRVTPDALLPFVMVGGNTIAREILFKPAWLVPDPYDARLHFPVTIAPRFGSSEDAGIGVSSEGG
jgi:Flp pilus assembly pilin Flp